MDSIVEGFNSIFPVQFIDADTGEDVTEEVMQPSFSRLASGRNLRQVISQFEESTTQQQFYDSTDIQKIYERCLREGISPLDLTGNGPGQYGDVSELQGTDLTTLIDRVQTTSERVEDFHSSYVPPTEEAAPAPPPVPSGDVPEPTPS